jgi:hypothetical protein
LARVIDVAPCAQILGRSCQSFGELQRKFKSRRYDKRAGLVYEAPLSANLLTVLCSKSSFDGGEPFRKGIG